MAGSVVPFPCWLRHIARAVPTWIHLESAPLDWPDFDYWHPDQPTPPTETPSSSRPANEGGAHHNLKTWPVFFEAILSGAKTFEIRKNDRAFKVGDILLLDEYDHTKPAYTGRQCERVVTYITDWAQKTEENIIVMGIAPVSHPQQPSAGQGEACPECGGAKPWCELRDRIRNYFGNGGLFNPELMEHRKVSDLLMDIAKAIDQFWAPTQSAPPAPGEPPAKEGETQDTLERLKNELLKRNQDYGLVGELIPALEREMELLYEPTNTDKDVAACHQMIHDMDKELTAAKAELASAKDLIEHIQAKLDTDETGHNLIGVAHDAHQAELRLPQLEADLKAKQIEYAAALDTLRDISSRNAQLEAAADEGKKDSRRLDWLDAEREKNAIALDGLPKCGLMKDGRWAIHIQGRGFVAHQETGLRAAIDAAMSPSPATGTGKEGESTQ